MTSYKSISNQNRTKTEPKPNQNRIKTEPKPNQNRTKTEQKNRILELLSQNPAITRAEIAEILTLHESSVQRRLETLVKERKLRHIGPTKGGSWEVIE